MIPGNDTTVYSVSSLTRELKNLVEGRYRFISVQGEISNLKIPFSGHAYFTLKDTGAQLKGVLFKGQARYLEKAINDGQQVICHGRISIYEPRGDYQIIVDSINFQGSGLLQQRFEKLKNQLGSEGLFDRERKQELTPFPKNTVLITSPSGAAVHDFLNIWRKKSFPTNITIFPVRVQGDSAAAEIAAAIASTNRTFPDTDTIILCRGGGSLEDLWAFNEEIVARAIARSKIPIVSAIGHDVDFSISDFCADLRAPTPTAAAEIIIPNGKELLLKINRFQTILTNRIHSIIDSRQYHVDQNSRLLGDMDFLFTNSSLRLDHTALKLYTVMEKRIARSAVHCKDLSARLQNNSPVAKLQIQEQRLKFAIEKLGYLFNKCFVDKEISLDRQAALLDSVSPLRTMARGYSITSKINPNNGEKTIIRKSRQLQRDDQVEILFHEGAAKCKVLTTKKTAD